MQTTPGYALLDAGDERRLERFGTIVLDRPAPTAIGPRREAAAWAAADARFEREAGGDVIHARWITRNGEPIEPWTLSEDALTFELRLAPSGQVGLFPEQVPNRRWIAGRLDRGPRESEPTEPSRILNLFGHTGGSTLAAAHAGAVTTHVDGSRPAVAWARRNAELSGLGDRPIRWIADDAISFARREARRGHRYDGIVLDPPTYGHGPDGTEWRLERDLPDLLLICAGLLADGPAAFLVVTTHTPGIGASELHTWLASTVGPGHPDVREMELTSASGVSLWLGWSVCWTRERP
ncbi:MAG: class I SAM-dependent methyltransferase [Candidatus Limnocylindrales bacterium]